MSFKEPHGQSIGETHTQLRPEVGDAIALVAEIVSITMIVVWRAIVFIFFPLMLLICDLRKIRL